MGPKYLLFSLLILSSSSLSSSNIDTNPPQDPNQSEFIRSACNARTTYPSLCFHSLIRYAADIGDDPVLLARAAAAVSLAHVRSLSAHIARILIVRRRYPTNQVLLDCRDSVGDAADEIRDSVAEIEKLETAVGPEVAWRVSNAQTWISAALTNEDTCADGFEARGGEEEGDLRDDVCGKVRMVKMFTSNALALVNALVAG